MIVKEEFLSKLRRYFSLNLYEVKIWAALLSRGVSTAGELSDIAIVPRSRSYDILESLEKKGFAISDGKEVIFMVLDDKDVHPTYDIGIWVNTPFFASALEELFEAAWKNMKPAKEVIKV